MFNLIYNYFVSPRYIDSEYIKILRDNRNIIKKNLTVELQLI